MTDTELLLACYDAYARGEIEQAIAPLHPDADWVEPESFPNGGRHQGRDAVAEYLRQSRQRWAELTVEPVAHQRGRHVIVVVRHHGILLDGTSADVTVADVFTLRDGRVARMQAFADPAEAFDAFPTTPTVAGRKAPARRDGRSACRSSGSPWSPSYRHRPGGWA